MNIFFTSKDPQICATNQCDKHVLKMSVEYAQMMSTAHRVLDGQPYFDKTINNRKITRWKLCDNRENILYKASHYNHCSNIWLRESIAHYQWFFNLWLYTIVEYMWRFQNTHKGVSLLPFVEQPPTNIPNKPWLRDPPPAMPDIYKVSNNSIQSYINFYNGDKSTFAKWEKISPPPSWYTGVYNASL